MCECRGRRCRGRLRAREAVDYAREKGLALAVRGGGHSVPGFGTVDDGVVADLSGMQAVRVDAEKPTARAEGGATWGAFNEATGAFGLIRLRCYASGARLERPPNLIRPEERGDARSALEYQEEVQGREDRDGGEGEPIRSSGSSPVTPDRYQRATRQTRR
jgi:FAD binding domain